MSADERRGWLDLRRAAEYSSLSIRTLRKYIDDPVHPLPVKLAGGKFILRQLDLDMWLQGFPAAGEQRDRLVDELLAEL